MARLGFFPNSYAAAGVRTHVSRDPGPLKDALPNAVVSVTKVNWLQQKRQQQQNDNRSNLSAAASRE